MTTANESPSGPERPTLNKLRGHVALRLMRDIAEGNMTTRQMGAKYGVVSSSITEFKQRNIAEINEIKADLENEFAGLWIAEKRNRLAEMQQDLIRVETLIDLAERWEPCDCEDPGCKAKQRPAAQLLAAVKRKRELLRSIAEELGQIPNRVSVQIGGTGQPVLHQLVGVDPDAL